MSEGRVPPDAEGDPRSRGVRVVSYPFPGCNVKRTTVLYNLHEYLEARSPANLSAGSYKHSAIKMIHCERYAPVKGTWHFLETYFGCFWAQMFLISSK